MAGDRERGGRIVKLLGDGRLAEFDLPSRTMLRAFELSSELRRSGIESRPSPT